MSSDAIPEDLRDFIVKYIDSIAHLEALLLLRATSSQDWTTEACASRLYISESGAESILSNLASKGFLASTEKGYHFACESKELETLVTRLSELYRQQLIPVTNLIHSKQRGIRDFADAFRLRKDP